MAENQVYGSAMASTLECFCPHIPQSATLSVLPVLVPSS